MKILKLLNNKFLSILLIIFLFCPDIKAEEKPIDDLPEPIMPKKTKFSFDFISFCIEKTQICLNLILTNVYAIYKKYKFWQKSYPFNYKIRFNCSFIFWSSFSFK